MEIKNTRIATSLHEKFDHCIDLSDVKPEEKESAFLTRALASLSLVMISDASNESAADAVVDGYHDMGIDLIYFDENTQKLIITQSKWINDAKGTPDTGSIHKIVDGANRIINLQFDGANEKIRNKVIQIEDAVKRIGVQIEVIIIYAGNQNISSDAKDILDRFMYSIDEGTQEIISYKVFSQKEVYRFLSDGQSGYEVNCEDLVINNWGKHDEPHPVYYGMISAKLLAEWYGEHGQRLFDKNIRYFRGSTEVNEGIINVIRDEPENFFYYNNGIKAICLSIERKAINSTDHRTGIFSANGISIVNGAQTTGAIYLASQKYPEEVERAKVLAQFISLQDTPESYADQITKLSNTQNRIDSKDFVSLDLTQDRLKRELQFSHIEYLYKSGSDMTDKNNQCTFDEALVSMACFQEDLTLVATVKRNIGALVADVTKAPYKTLFNDSTSSNLIWNIIRIMRRVETVLKQQEFDYQGKDRLVLVHGNRVILHMIFNLIQRRDQNLLEIINRDVLEDFVNENIDSIIDETQRRYLTKFPDAYPANVFKNVGRIRILLEG